MARTVQAGWRGHQARTRDPEVREVKEELRNMRLEAHTKQLSKELRNARAALEQERKLRKVQSDTIKVLWKEIQSLQMENENEREYDSYDGHPGHRGRYPGEKGRGYAGDAQRASLSKSMRVTERKLSRLLQGAQYEDSDSSRGQLDFLLTSLATCFLFFPQSIAQRHPDRTKLRGGVRH